MIPVVVVMDSIDAGMTIDVSELAGGQIMQASLDEKQDKYAPITVANSRIGEHHINRREVGALRSDGRTWY